MTTSRLDVRREEPARQHGVSSPVVPNRMVLYGDFNCPWSYLATRRAALLATLGTDVDWRAVEHESSHADRSPAASAPGRFAALRHEMDEVLAALVPGETLPYCLAGFLPHTRSAIAGYAEAYLAGVAAPARDVLFEGFWLHAIDLADEEVVHTLLVDAVRCGSSPAEHLGHWGYDTAPIGDVTNAAQRLAGTWFEEWRDIGDSTVPVVRVDGAAPLTGKDAVRWLGRAVLDLGLVSSQLPTHGRLQRATGLPVKI